MEIENAFIAETIQAAGTNLTAGEERTFRGVLDEVCQAYAVEWTQKDIEVGMICFIAGRTYQADGQPSTIQFEMPPALATQFMEFLSARLEERS